MEENKTLRARVFRIIQIGSRDDHISVAFDYVLVATIVLNLSILFASTFSEMAPYMPLLRRIEWVTVVLFIIEYLLRIWTADYLYPKDNKGEAVLHYILSFDGLVSLLSILPYFLLMLPAGMVAFRMLRVLRVFHLFRINAQYDAFHVVLDVIRGKVQQIISSMALILIMMLASSILMYSVEHNAQPEVFRNAFSGIWWSVSALLTVGYGDIYPVTVLGQILAIILSFLGVGLVAIPTGIISAGFVEQYTRVKSMSESAEGNELRFIMITMEAGHPWIGQQIAAIGLPPEIMIATIIRGEDEVVLAQGDETVQLGDRLVLGAIEYLEHSDVKVREFVIPEGHIWSGRRVGGLELSKDTTVVSIVRDKKAMTPKKDTIILQGDLVTVCEKQK
ncbi:MAG: ion transporter [Lachnospiraceae bacterium]|nr:ion transporter [Lachnospiraceae bacterium]